MNELAQFLACVTKVFALGRLVRAVRCRRLYTTAFSRDKNLASRKPSRDVTYLAELLWGPMVA